MKYKDKYPNLKEIYEDIDGIIKGSKEKECTTCKELTQYIEINYEAPFCSDECLSNFEIKIGVC